MKSLVARPNDASTAPAALTKSAKPLSPASPAWLAGWKAADTLPASARAEAQACIPALEAALVPADEAVMGVAIHRLLDWIVDFGIVPLPVDQKARQSYLARLAARYDEHLRILPPDLLLACVEETMAAHRFRNLPLPADMIARVSAEFGRRKTALGGCRLALKLNRFDRPPLTAAERVRPEQLRRLREDLAADAIARLPGSEEPEYGEPPPPANPRQDRRERA
jgi:hypothetical protein